MTHPFFSTSFRRDPQQPRDLHARIDAQLVERIEEAVDFVCLDALVRTRRARGGAEPAADNETDRQEFRVSVEAFLARLERELLRELPQAQQQRIKQRATGSGADALVMKQVGLARELPHYWQRFDEIREAYTAQYVAAGGIPPAPDDQDSSRGEPRGALRRLLGRR